MENQHFAFLSESYFQVANTLGRSVTHYFIKKIAISANNIKSFVWYWA